MGVPDRPPYAMRSQEGPPSGLAVDLWRLVAETLALDYAFVAVAVAADDAAGALARGEADLVLAVDARAALEAQADLSQPLYTASLGVVTPGGSIMLRALEAFVSWRFAQIVAGLSALLLLVGALVWAAERRGNREEFAPGAVKGLGDGFWWAGVTLTTIGYGDKTPATTLGRSVAMVWMLVGLAVNAALTATIVTLADAEEDPFDRLPDLAVAAVEGSSAALYLARVGADLTLVASVGAALDALERGEVEAAAAAAPVLRHAIAPSDPSQAARRVRTTSFDPHHGVIAMPEGSALREPIDRALLTLLAGESGQGVVERYLPGA